MATDTGATSRILYINSATALAQNGNLTQDPTLTTTYYEFTLEQPISCPSHHSMILTLHSCSIPYTFYHFRTGINCNIKWALTSEGQNWTPATPPAGSVTDEIVLPEGNYNVITLRTEIQKQLYASPVWVAGSTLDFNYNPDSQKYEWRYTKAGAGVNLRRLTFDFADSIITLGTGEVVNISPMDEMGFDNNKWALGQGGPFVHNVWFEDNITANEQRGGRSSAGLGTFQLWHGARTDFFQGYWIDGFGPTGLNYFSCVDMNANLHNLYVKSSLTTESMLDGTNDRTGIDPASGQPVRFGMGALGGYSNTLARIAVNQQAGETITVSPTDGAVHQILLKHKDVTSVVIKLCDRNNRIIDLQGLDWDLSLQFDFIKTPLPDPQIDQRLKVEQRMYQDYLSEVKGDKTKN